jgi:hypothetical protein
MSAEITDAEFDRAYRYLAQLGKCDTPGGMEYQRVKSEWLEHGQPPPLPFITVGANPYAEPDPSRITFQPAHYAPHYSPLVGCFKDNGDDNPPCDDLGFPDGYKHGSGYEVAVFAADSSEIGPFVEIVAHDHLSEVYDPGEVIDVEYVLDRPGHVVRKQCILLSPDRAVDLARHLLNAAAQLTPT